MPTDRPSVENPLLRLSPQMIQGASQAKCVMPSPHSQFPKQLMCSLVSFTDDLLLTNPWVFNIDNVFKMMLRNAPY